MNRASLPGLALIFSSLFFTAGNAQDLDEIEVTFRKAVVKIDVSTNAVVIREGKNICVSEGTGFVITSKHIATAQHVYILDPDCGEPIIIIKSKALGLQKLAKPVAAKDDVGLLEVEGGLPKDICSLGLRSEDVFETQAIRFGIPGGFSEPPGAMGVKIGSKLSEFAPLVLMTPTATEQGESGGPVIYRFNVVGMTHGKHEKYTAFSFMTVGSIIRSIMAENSIQPSGHLCNPAEVNMTVVSPRPPGNHGFGEDGSVSASIHVGDPLNAEVRDEIETLRKSFNADAGRVFIGPDPTKAGNLLIKRPIKLGENKGAVVSSITNAVTFFSQQVQENLWNDYVAVGNKTGKWKDAEPDRFPEYTWCWDERNPRSAITCQSKYLPPEEFIRMDLEMKSQHKDNLKLYKNEW